MKIMMVLSNFVVVVEMEKEFVLLFQEDLRVSEVSVGREVIKEKGASMEKEVKEVIEVNVEKGESQV